MRNAARILFMTSPEHGQANVQLAVIASLKKRHGDQVDIYMSSYESFRSRVPAGVIFKPVNGRGLNEYYQGAWQHVNTAPGFVSAIRAILKIMMILHPEGPTEYVATVLSIEQVISEVAPTLVAVDNFFVAARDALSAKKQPHVLLSPNTLKDLAGADQGAGVFLWPVQMSGYPFPLPWYLLLPNALILLLAPIYIFFFDLFRPRESPVLCVSTPGTDYPAVIPPDVICCGPILQEFAPLEDVDPELHAWLSQRPTVLIVLGSHVRLSEEAAGHIYRSLQHLLEARKDVQVLWKLQKQDNYELRGLASYGDRIVLVDWLRRDPIAILRTGYVVCFVHHGGSNSYHEALATGTPQVILSPWFDCHDFANRAEWLGIGKWGNRKHAPGHHERELTPGETPDARDATRIRERAREVGEVAVGRRDAVFNRATGQVQVQPGVLREAREGRDVAAAWIWDKAQELIRKDL
ncbi:hypothetical protein C8Q76DRAFT_788342 [Earliella scabrosa]|nr:hypothetical protein C8Q76DRAFT_788342 [Earliella scabrosa]